MRLYALLFTICAMTIFFPFTARAAADNHALLATGGNGWVNAARPLTAEDMQNRLTLLDFWTYGCINCMQVIPDLKYLEEQFGEKLLVIGVHSAKFSGETGNERIAAAAKRFGLEHPVINDSDYAVWKAMDVHAWPTLILLGPDGTEISRYSGEGHRAELERDMKKALKKLDGPVTPLADLLPQEETKTKLLSFPARLAFGNGLLWIADSGHNRIIAVNPESGEVKETIGTGTQGRQDGPLETAQFNHPRGLTLAGHILYVADTDNHALRAVDLEAKTVTTRAGTGQRGWQLDTKKTVKAEGETLASPWDVEFMEGGKTLAIANAGTHQIYGYDTANQTLFVLAGNGRESLYDAPAPRATLAQPSGLSLTADGTLFFVDAESSSLRALSNNRVNTLIGTGLFDFGLVDGRYPAAQLQHAQGLAATSEHIILADTYNNVLRLYDRASGVLSTLPLKGGTLNEPGDVLIVGETVYIADTNNHAIKTIDLKTGALKTIVE